MTLEQQVSNALESMLVSPELRTIEAACTAEQFSLLENAVQHGLAELASPRADLAFIGGFSSGKSTLINALLGEKLLPTGRSVVTQRPVWIRAADERSSGYWRDDAYTSSGASPRDGVAAWLTEEPHDWDDSSQRHWFGVNMAAWPFQPWVTIIDTPGFNSEEPCHRELTLQALDEAEVAVVVVPPRGLAADERAFIKEEVLRRTRSLAFVLNQIDIVDSEDVGELVAIVERQAAEEFAVPDAPILLCSARGAVDRASGLDGWANVSRWLDDVAERTTVHAVAKKVAVTTKRVFDEMRRELRDESAAVEQSTTEVAREIEAWSGKLEVISEFGDGAKVLRAKIRRASAQTQEQISAKCTRSKSSMNEWLEDQTHDLNDDKRVNKRFKKALHTPSKATAAALEAFAADCDKWVAEWWASAEAAMNERWSAIATTAGEAALESRGVALDVAVPTQLDLGPLDADSVVGKGVGALIGRFVGTMLAPGPGTVSAMAIGGFLGSLFGGGREKRREAVAAALDERLFELESTAVGQLAELREQYNSSVTKARRNRKRAYKRRLNRLKDELDSARQANDERLAALEAAGEGLEVWTERLDDLSRGN